MLGIKINIVISVGEIMHEHGLKFLLSFAVLLFNT